MSMKATLAGLTLFALATQPARAQGIAGTGWWDGGWGHMAYGGIMMVLVWGGLIVLAVVLVRYLARGSDYGPTSSRGSPLDILDERFARGEIDQQEYETRRKLLSEGRR